jgi:exodeoxyribonuclease VII small subunit
MSGDESASPAGEQPPFEEALEELEALVAALEGGGQSLEHSLESFERGVRLVRLCAERLQAAELRLKQLEPTPEGPRERPLELDEES